MIFSYLLNMQSHPSWVCGLKPEENSKFNLRTKVTPFVGVWIETFARPASIAFSRSHPSWVCGLKRNICRLHLQKHDVTPFVGVWIETGLKAAIAATLESHTLRGCVD